jgi:hypothetical protein
VAEAAITAMAIQLGLVVLRPMCEGGRYDLAIDLEPELLRVQCKIARRLSGVLSVCLQTSRHTPGGYVRTSYTAAEVDAIAAYSPELRVRVGDRAAAIWAQQEPRRARPATLSELIQGL